MSVMWLLVVLLAVSVIATLVARRRVRGERDSVDSQQRRLDALRTAVSGTHAPAGEITRAPLPGPRRLRERRRRARSTSRTAFVAGAVLVAGLAVLGVVAVVSSSDDTSRVQPDLTSSRPPRTSPTDATSTTSTTVPRPVGVVSADGRTVTVSLPAGAYEITLNARGACWIRAQRADNTVVDTTTLHAGDSHQLAESGPLTVRLGNPGVVDVEVNGQALSLPTTNRSPVDLQLNPTA